MSENLEVPRKPGRPRRWSVEEAASLKKPSVRFTPEQVARVKALASVEAKTVSDLLISLVDETIAEHEHRAVIELITRRNLEADLARRAAADEDEESGEVEVPPAPQSPGAPLLAAGRAEMDAKKWVSALGYFRRAIAAEPGNVEAHHQAGVALVQMTVGGSGKDREMRDLQKQAIAAFKEVLRLDPNHAEAARALRLAEQPLPTKGKR